MKRLTGKGILGINEAKDPTLLEDKYLQSSLNMRHNKDLSIETRTGYDVEVSGSVPVLDIFQTNILGDTEILAANETSVNIIENNTLSPILDGLVATDASEMIQFNNKLIYANGIDTVKKTSINSDLMLYTLTYRASVPTSINLFSSIYTAVKMTQVTTTSMAKDDTYIYLANQTTNSITKTKLDGTVVLTKTYSYPNFVSKITYSNGFIYAISQYPYQFMVTINADTLDIVTQTTISPPYSSYPYTVRNIYADDSFIYATFSPVTGAATKIVVYSISSPGLSIAVFDWNTYGTITSTSMVTFNGVTYFTSAAILQNKKLSNVYGSLEASSIRSSIIGVHNNTLIGWYNYNFLVYSGETVTETHPTNEQILGIYDNSTKTYFWQDLCSPGSTIANTLSDAGQVGSIGPDGRGNTYIQYKSTWYDVNYKLETTPGLASNITLPALKKVEVFFDYTASQITKEKADLLPVDKHRLYRKDNTAEYKLQGEYPIYWDAVTEMTLSGNIISISDNNDMPIDPGTTDSFYIVWEEEILQVTDITIATDTNGTTTTTWDVLRAQKGSSLDVHPITQPIYLFSIMDNSSSSSLGTITPTDNDYIEKARLLLNYKGRLILGNSDARPSRLWYSSFLSTGADEDIIENESWHEIRKDDGTQIRSLTVFNDNIMALKDRSITYLQGDLDVPNLIDFSTTIGCVASKSNIEYYTGNIFLSREGIIYQLGQQLINLTTNWIPTTIESINWDKAYLSAAIYFEKYNEYWLSVPTGNSTVPNKIIVMNLALSDMTSPYTPKSFAIFDIQANCFGIILDDTGQDTVYCGQENGHLLILDRGTDDDGTLINATFKTRAWNLGKGEHIKFRRIITDFKQTGSGEVLVEYATDTALSGSYEIPLSGDLRVPHIGSFDQICGHNMEIEYSNVSGEPFKVYNIAMDVKPHKIRSI